MTNDDSRNWMWSEALQMLARAERLHREVFTPAQGSQRGKADRPAAVKDEESEKAPHVVAIGAQSVPAHAPFMRQTRKPSIGQFTHTASHRTP